MATIKANIMRLSCDVHCDVFNYEKRRKGYWENYNLNVNPKNDAPEVPDSGVHNMNVGMFHRTYLGDGCQWMRTSPCTGKRSILYDTHRSMRRVLRDTSRRTFPVSGISIVPKHIQRLKSGSYVLLFKFTSYFKFPLLILNFYFVTISQALLSF